MTEDHQPAGVRSTGSPALGADAAGAAFDLTVYVQQARVVALGLLRADLRERGSMAVGLLTGSQLSPPSSHSFLHASPTHWPLGNVIRPDVGPTGGWLFTGPESSGQIMQNKKLGYPSPPHPPTSVTEGSSSSWVPLWTHRRLWAVPGVLVAHNRRWLLLAQIRLV